MAHKTTQNQPEWKIDLQVVSELLMHVRSHMENVEGLDLPRETALALVDKAQDILRPIAYGKS